MLTSRSPLKVGIEVGSENGRNSDTQQKPGQPPVGTPPTGDRSYAPPLPTSHPCLPHSWQRKEERPTWSPGISQQPLHPLEPTPYRSRCKGGDLNNIELRGHRDQRGCVNGPRHTAKETGAGQSHSPGFLVPSTQLSPLEPHPELS